MADDINSVGEEENDSKGAADVDSYWVSSMMKKLDPNHCKFSQFVICKVHRDIRKDDHGAYTPKIVSIGPFHRRDENLQAMEEVKRHYLNNILRSDDSNKEGCLKKYLKKMKKIEPSVRSCYSEKIDMNPQEFVEMMVLDGCFLIQLFFQEQHKIKNEDPIYNNYWRLPLIAHDILLLENQLPFVVLEELCPLLRKEKNTLWKQALDFYEHALLPMEFERTKPKEIYHLLHLMHMFFKPAASALPQNSSTPPSQKSPQELKQTPSGQQSPREEPQISGAAQSTVCGSASISAQSTMGRGSPTPPGEQSPQELKQPPSGQQSPREAPQIKGAAQSIVCGSAPISALTMGRRSPTPRGEQSSQEIEYTPSRQQSSQEVPLIYASTPIGSAPTHSITIDCLPPTPPGEQSAQELQHTLSSEQSSPEAYIRSGEDQLVALGSAPIYSITRPPASHVKIKNGGQSFYHSSELSASFPIGSAPINPKTKDRSPPGLPGAHPVGTSGNTESKRFPPPQPPKKTIPTATELQEAGLTFSKSKKLKNFLDVTFKEGKLEMPCLRIDDSTNSLFRNFIAFEQCFPKWGSHFTSYCFFMDSLVNTAKDVGILSRKDVIENLLGSDEDVALLFNKLCRGVFINFDDSYLAEVFNNINRRTKKWWPRQRANLMRDYFSNPWSMLSVAAASLIIVLTLVQTFFTIFAYFRPPKS